MSKLYHPEYNKNTKISSLFRNSEDQGLQIWGSEFMSNTRLITTKEDFSYSSWKQRSKMKLETQLFNLIHERLTEFLYLSYP